jgi:hypothetical protein
MNVEGNADVIRLFLSQHLFECLDKSEDGRGVIAFAVDEWAIDESIVGTVDQGVCVKQK